MASDKPVKLDWRYENITPERAKAYLNRNKANRKLRDGIVERYNEDMKRGRWTECVAPIVFYDDGDIADGQHRLWAIVESGCTVQFLVARGLPRSAGLNIDIGGPRTLVDNARISGLDDGLSNELLSVSRMYVEGIRQSQTVSNSTKLDYVNQCREYCEWAISHGPRGKGFRNATILAALARAKAFGVEEERLTQFGRVFASGFPNGTEDAAAIALRNYLISRGNRVPPSEQRDYFLKAQNAIAYFAKGKPLHVIKAVKEEVYPVKRAKGNGARAQV